MSSQLCPSTEAPSPELWIKPGREGQQTPSPSGSIHDPPSPPKRAETPEPGLFVPHKPPPRHTEGSSLLSAKFRSGAGAAMETGLCLPSPRLPPSLPLSPSGGKAAGLALPPPTPPGNVPLLLVATAPPGCPAGSPLCSLAPSQGHFGDHKVNLGCSGSALVGSDGH